MGYMEWIRTWEPVPRWEPWPDWDFMAERSTGLESHGQPEREPAVTLRYDVHAQSVQSCGARLVKSSVNSAGKHANTTNGYSSQPDTIHVSANVLQKVPPRLGLGGLRLQSHSERKSDCTTHDEAGNTSQESIRFLVGYDGPVRKTDKGTITAADRSSEQATAPLETRITRD